MCKNNGRIATDSESGEIICNNCGMVISDKIQDITRPEWRGFSAEEVNDRSRTGSPTSLSRYDMGLATIIGKTDRDVSGQKIDVAMCTRMQRLKDMGFEGTYSYFLLIEILCKLSMNLIY